jgi:flagellar biosynthesis protein FlhA
MSIRFATQLFRNHQVVFIAAGIIGGMGLIPGMPNFVFLLFAGSLIWLGLKMKKFEDAAARQKVKAATPPPRPASEAEEASWSDVAPTDMLGLEVGYRLIPLVDKAQDGELLRRIRGIRKKFAQEVGFLVSPVHIRDNLELKPNAYRILLKGVDIGQGEVFPGQFLAINPGRVLGTLPGKAARDPAFGLEAIWIEASLRDQAQAYGYTVASASTVVATHLNHLLLTHAAVLLGRQELQQLLDHLAKEVPKLVEELTPKLLAVGIIQKVLQNLLEEGIAIRDMRTILETLSDFAPKTQNPDDLTAQVRLAMSRTIAQDLYPAGQPMQVMTLDPQLERLLLQSVAAAGGAFTLEPGLAETLLKEAVAACRRQTELGLPPVLLVPGAIRLLLFKFLQRSIPEIRVLAHGEIPADRQIKVTSIIGGRS